MKYRYIYITALFILCYCLSSCTMSKQIRFIDAQIQQSKYRVNQYNTNPFSFGIPKFRDSDYKLEIEFREQKDGKSPYVNSVLIWLGGKKKPIAYWIRAYRRTVTPQEGCSTHIYQQYAFDLVERRDILILSPRRKELKELLSFIISNKTYLSFTSIDLAEKYHAYVEGAQYSYSIHIRNRTRYNTFTFDDPTTLMELRKYKELEDFVREIHLIRRAVGANPMPELERFLPENTAPQKQE